MAVYSLLIDILYPPPACPVCQIINPMIFIPLLTISLLVCILEEQSCPGKLYSGHGWRTDGSYHEEGFNCFSSVHLLLSWSTSQVWAALVPRQWQSNQISVSLSNQTCDTVQWSCFSLGSGELPWARYTWCLPELHWRTDTGGGCDQKEHSEPCSTGTLNVPTTPYSPIDWLLCYADNHSEAKIWDNEQQVRILVCIYAKDILALNIACGKVHSRKLIWQKYADHFTMSMYPVVLHYVFYFSQFQVWLLSSFSRQFSRWHAVHQQRQ